MPSINLSPPFICSKLELPDLPTLPAGISLGIDFPGIGFDFDLTLCCKIFQFPVGLLPPIDLGISIQLPIVVALNNLIVTINAYLDAIPMFCPKEAIDEALTQVGI